MTVSTYLRIAALAAAVACGGASPADHLEAAQAALAAQDFAKAAQEASQGLAANPADEATKWRLELVGIEAQARQGDKDAAIATLERLAGAWPQQVKGSLYVSTADQLRAGGNNAGAIELLDAGLKRFPDDPDLTKAIDQAKKSGGTDELEMLKSLGYIGD